MPARETARWREALGGPGTVNGVRATRWVRSMLLRSHVPDMDSRVERAIRTLAQQPLDRRTTSLARLAQGAGLSASRFGHVFTESVGVPVRAYMRWLRLQRAARALVSGRSATQAAYRAGFSDAAHLTRTFRRTLGVSPRIEIHGRVARADTRSAIPVSCIA